MTNLALCGARIFDGQRFHDDCVLLVSGSHVDSIVARDDLASTAPNARIVRLDGGLLAPGFVDLQVNGGGGVMLNDAPSANAMARISEAHNRLGTTALFPTLITDTAERSDAAIMAAVEAIAACPSIAGLHLEGPHLAPARKGAHPADLMRPVTDNDINLYVRARERIGALLITVAGEQITAKQVRRLVAGNVTVSIGHSDCPAPVAEALFDAGARGATHLFNAMSGLAHRAPGVAAAALADERIWCGIIADGFHVDARLLRIALAAKQAEGRLFFVSDAMALTGSDNDSFMLHGRRVARERTSAGSRLTLDDGTLAGSALDMAGAIRFAVARLGVSLQEALRMATCYPARFAGLDPAIGTLMPGARADIVHLGDDLMAAAVWIEGGSATR